LGRVELVLVGFLVGLTHIYFRRINEFNLNLKII